MGMFEIFRGGDNLWYFRLKARNGKIIAQSEGYCNKSGALNGINSCRENAVDSGTVYKI